MPDAGLAHMVENEHHLRAAPRQLDSEGERPVLDADVEGEAVAADGFHAFDEARLEAEAGVWFDLDQAADATQRLEALQRLEVGLDRLPLLDRDVRHHAAEPR